VFDNETLFEQKLGLAINSIQILKSPRDLLVFVDKSQEYPQSKTGPHFHLNIA